LYCTVDLLLLLNSKRRLQNTDVSTLHYKAVTLIKKKSPPPIFYWAQAAPTRYMDRSPWQQQHGWQHDEVNKFPRRDTSSLQYLMSKQES